MIYIISLLLCLFLAWRYDVCGYTKGKWNWYYILLVWFVCVSGFQYMVGSDMAVYMKSYQRDYYKLRLDLGDLGGRYQPGWILLSYYCRQITDDFVLFKFIHAAFVNVAVFSFFRRETKYVFLCITLYAITTYLIFNFNVLRQSFAIGFMLYYISYLKRDKYVLAFIFLFAAFMFHNTALIGLIIPLFKFLKYDKKIIVAIFVLSIMFVYFLVRLDMDTLLSTLIDSGYLGNNIEEHAEIYAESQKFGAREVGIGLGRLAQVLLTIFVVFYFIWKKKDLYAGGIGLMYLLMLVTNYAIPIMFRIRQYFDMSFYVMFSMVIIELSSGRLKQIKHFIVAFFIVIYSLYPFKEYFYRYPGSPYRYIDQYYPYHSIFNPDVDHRKKTYFKL